MSDEEEFSEEEQVARFAAVMKRVFGHSTNPEEDALVADSYERNFGWIDRAESGQKVPWKDGPGRNRERKNR